jgi:hypothetical protein
LLTQIPTTVINWVAVIWAVTIFFTDRTTSEIFWAYIIFAGLSTFLYFIFNLVAAYKARQGKMFYFLFFGNLAYQFAYKVKVSDNIQPSGPVNKPPF